MAYLLFVLINSLMMMMMMTVSLHLKKKNINLPALPRLATDLLPPGVAGPLQPQNLRLGERSGLGDGGSWLRRH